MNNKKNVVQKGSGKNKKQRTPFGNFVHKIVKIFVIFVVIVSLTLVAVVGGSIIGFIKTATPLSIEQLQLTGLTTMIYDKNGKQIAKLTGKDNIDRIVVEDKGDNIPKNLKDAVVAIEDERYYQHTGVDFIGFIRAAVKKILNPKSVEGGSTITMQLVKNLTGEDKVTLQRKIQEQWRAYQLEKKLSKAEILTLYMNLVHLGGNSYGIQSASLKYFGKKVKNLNLAQCASLAGIIKSPNYYAPDDSEGIKKNIERMIQVLKRMQINGFITQEEYDAALKEDIGFVKEGVVPTDTVQVEVLPYFVEKAISDVKKDMEAKGYSESEINLTVYNGGLKIYTTMDSSAQKAMNKVFTNSTYFPGGTINGKKPQAAMVVIDPSTGQVRAMYGGNGKKTGSTLNRATQAYRQTGSSFKPLAVYGPSIDQKLITAATVIDDSPTYMNGTGRGKYPQNFPEGGGVRVYRGLVTIRTGIVRSINIVAAKVFRDYLGAEKSFEYLKKAGLDMEARKETKSVSLSLGGLTYGVTPLEMAAAYVPFDNKGIYLEPITYSKVEDKYGETVLNKLTDSDIKQTTNVVYSEQTAYIMTSMMRDVCRPGGTASYVNFTNAAGKSISLAGKTGTTDDDKDRWFIGYSPDYVASVWYGYDTPATVSVWGNNPSAVIWSAVMKEIHKKVDAKPFDSASGIVRKSVCKYSGQYPTSLCSKDSRGSGVITENFIRGTQPKSSNPCKVHVSVKICKSSKDIYGRYLLAGPACPKSKTSFRIMLKRPISYMPVYKYDPYPGDWWLTAPIEYCTKHH